MARHIHGVGTLALLIALLLSVQIVGAAGASDQMQISIDKGLAWLALQQNLDHANPESYGSWGASPTSCGNDDRVEKTAFAVVKLIEQARERGEVPPAAVQDGLNFIMRKVQSDGSIWDYYDYESCGTENAPPKVAETGAAMIAIASTETPDAVVDQPGAPVANGQSYRWVVGQAAAYLAWAQRTSTDSDLSGYGDEGGWTRGKDPEDPQALPYFVSMEADQVDTGYATMGLLYARDAFGIPVPQGVEDRLRTWIGNIQDSNGGAPYIVGSPYTNIHYTGDLLIEQYLVGRNPDDSGVRSALEYIGNNWDTWQGDSLAYYTLTSAFNLMGIDDLAGPGGSIDWFSDLSTRTMNTMVPDGGNGAYWPPDLFGDPILSTEWSLLTLEGKTVGAGMTLEAQVQPPVIPQGQQATCTARVTNTGQSAIYDLAITESSDTHATCSLSGVQPVRENGDQDGIFEPGEIWTYTAGASIPTTTIDSITASGKDLQGRPVTVTRDVTIAVNRAPVAVAQSVTTDENTPLSIPLIATDADGDPLIYAIGASPAHGTLGGNLPDGNVVYTPATGYSGPDSFTFSAYDGLDRSNAAPVTITVKPDVVNVNSPPEAIDQSVHTNENTPLGITLTATDSELDPLTYQVVTNPAHGTLTGSAPALTYTPATNYYGTDLFTFRAYDGMSYSAPGTIAISVVNVNHPPETSGASPSTACLWPPNHKFADVTIQGLHDPDGDPLTIAITKITSDEPSASGTGSGGKNHAPDATGIGTDTATLLRAERSGNNNGRVYAITFTASDGKGGITAGTVSVCVPHDESAKCICTDDGQRYDATSTI